MSTCSDCSLSPDSLTDSLRVLVSVYGPTQVVSPRFYFSGRSGGRFDLATLVLAPGFDVATVAIVCFPLCPELLHSNSVFLHQESSY